MRTLALSRLKEGFDLPRERHQFKNLINYFAQACFLIGDHRLDLSD